MRNAERRIINVLVIKSIWEVWWDCHESIEFGNNRCVEELKLKRQGNFFNYTLFTASVVGVGQPAPQVYRNPFDVPRSDLLDQLARMRANFLQASHYDSIWDHWLTHCGVTKLIFWFISIAGTLSRPCLQGPVFFIPSFPRLIQLAYHHGGRGTVHDTVRGDDIMGPTAEHKAPVLWQGLCSEWCMSGTLGLCLDTTTTFP